MLGLVGRGHYVTLGPTIRIHGSAILWASPEQKLLEVSADAGRSMKQNSSHTWLPTCLLS